MTCAYSISHTTIETETVLRIERLSKFERSARHMSISLPVQVQEVVAVVERTSRIGGGESGDVVTIHSLLQLAVAPQEELHLILPVYARDTVDAVLQPVEQVESRFEFNDPVPVEALPEEARRQYSEAIEKVRQSLEEAERLALRFAYRSVRVLSGSLEVRFDQQFIVNPTDGQFTFRMFLPLGNTPLQPGGVINVWVLLPPGAQGSLSSSGGGTNLGAVDVFGRQVHGWRFQADPILTVTYRYQ